MKNTHRRMLDTAASQVLQSGSSFLMTLGFAHFLAPADFGLLSGIWLLWMLILSMNRTVFAEQLLARRGEDPASAGYADFTAVWMAFLLLASGAAVASMQAWAVLPGTIFVGLFIAGDAVRYWVMANRSAEDFPLGMTALELIRTVMAAGFLWLSICCPESSGLAWTALIPGVVWLIPALRRFRPVRFRQAWSYLRQRGAFEAFMTTQFLTVTAGSQLLPMLAIPAFGPAPFGGLRLTQSLVSPAALVGTAFQPALLTAFAEKTLRRDRRRLLLVAIAAFSAFATVIVALGLLIVGTTGHMWIPASQQPAVNELLLPSLAAVAFTVVGQPGGALLRVLRWGGLSLAGQAAGVAAGLILALWVLGQPGAGIAGFAWALAAGQAVTVVLTYVLMFRRLNVDG